MCGIAGLIAFDRSVDVVQTLEAMNGAQVHRGPDDAGIHLFQNGRGGLANRRLAIRDRSPAGHMPMRNASNTIAITYNGELYNTEELRTDLEREGYTLRSSGDTEILLCGYEAWGESMVERLRGIHAFAIADERPGRRCLFLGRDRLGVKPLYYSTGPERTLFASELKGLLASGLVSREIDSAGLVGYLSLGSVPNPLTIYRDARGLEPGCTLSVSLDRPENDPRPHRYWTMPVHEREVGRAEAVEEVSELLLDAVRTQLVSDAPLGAFLSGGLDSGVVVGLMRRAGAEDIHTCSIAFQESEYSEGTGARRAAQAVRTNHVERIVRPDDLIRELPAILQAMDQPSADGINTYFVAQTARQAGLTVALSGLGGDELFGGYTNTFHGVPQFVRAASALYRVPGAAALTRAGLGLSPRREYWRKTVDALGRPIGAPSGYLARRGVFSSSEVRQLVGEDRWHDAAQRFEPVEHIADRAVLDGHDSRFEHRPFSWISRAELGTYTHHQLLRDTDVMSMAHSLEVRVPLLDHRLVEAVLTLPDEVKGAGGVDKSLLLDAASPLCPPNSLPTGSKQTFTFPLQHWLAGPVAPFMNDLVTNVIEHRLVEHPAAREVVTHFEHGRLHWSRPWMLAALACV